MADNAGSRELPVKVSEDISGTDALAAQLIPTKGIVAILDALGTKLLSVQEAIRFVALRDSIMQFTTNELAARVRDFDLSRLRILTLNDTVIFAYETAGEVTLSDVLNFCHLLRIAETKSIVHGFPFRGAFAIGDFFVGDERTILGPAISDAAAWFEAADWIGINATPHATIFVDALLERSVGAKLDPVLVNHSVPLKNNKTRQLKAINWPKGFAIAGLRPDGEGSTRGLVLSAFAKRSVPKGTESKYTNAIEFFDIVQKQQSFERVQVEDQYSALPARPG